MVMVMAGRVHESDRIPQGEGGKRAGDEWEGWRWHSGKTLLALTLISTWFSSHFSSLPYHSPSHKNFSPPLKKIKALAASMPRGPSSSPTSTRSSETPPPSSAGSGTPTQSPRLPPTTSTPLAGGAPTSTSASTYSSSVATAMDRPKPPELTITPPAHPSGTALAGMGVGGPVSRVAAGAGAGSGAGSGAGIATSNSDRSPQKGSNNSNAGGSGSSSSNGPPVSRRPIETRKRSSSLVTVERVEQSHEEMLDQSAGFNANAEWVNYKGE